MSRLITLLLAVLACSLAQAQSSAPFGLKWGSPLIKANCSSISTELNGLARVCKTTKVPKAVPYAESYALIYSSSGLVKVTALGVDITGDAYGTEGTAVYEKVKAALTKKYGEPSDVYERMFVNLYTESDEFYQCLNYEGCGVMASVWDTPGMSVSVGIVGVARGVGFIKIAYEHTKFNEMLSQRDAMEETALDSGL